MTVNQRDESRVSGLKAHNDVVVRLIFDLAQQSRVLYSVDVARKPGLSGRTGAQQDECSSSHVGSDVLTNVRVRVSDKKGKGPTEGER